MPGTRASIIELELLSSGLAATMLGEEIRTAEAGEKQQVIITRPFEQ